MKLATIERGENHAHVAVVVAGDELLDLVALRGVLPEAKDVPAEMRDLLAGSEAALAAVQQCIDRVEAMAADEQDSLRQSGILQAWDAVSFLPPVPDPTIILSVGMNYRRHLEEMENSPIPAYPPAFLMTTTALNGAASPPEDFQLEYTPPSCHAATPSPATHAMITSTANAPSVNILPNPIGTASDSRSN